MKRVFEGLGRLFGGGRGGLDGRVRWFGKLPAHADYVAAPDPAPFAHEFSDWLIQGFAKHQAAAGGGEYRPLGCSVGLLRVPRSATTVGFVLSDFGGDARGRRFPFALFFGLPTAQLPGPTAANFECFAPALRDLHGMLGAARSALARPDAGAWHAGTIEPAAPADPAALARRWAAMPWLDWRDAVLGAAAPTDSATWLAAIHAWGSRIAAHEQSDFPFNLSFPLAARWDWGIQAQGWLAWLARRIRLDRRAASIIVNFAPDSAQPLGTRLHVIARPIVPDDFLLLGPAADRLKYMDALPLTAADATPPDSPVSIPPDFAAFVTAGPELDGATRSRSG
ncbi:MAG: DUF2094 domain-containing protein [Planctomycetia bacterium]|nr:MAG: DUF2094 domain-containing protein [Planctomycetia bacterium]